MFVPPTSSTLKVCAQKRLSSKKPSVIENSDLFREHNEVLQPPFSVQVSLGKTSKINSLRLFCAL